MESNPKAEALSNLQYTAEEMYQTMMDRWLRTDIPKLIERLEKECAERCYYDDEYERQVGKQSVLDDLKEIMTNIEAFEKEMSHLHNIIDQGLYPEAQLEMDLIAAVTQLGHAHPDLVRAQMHLDFEKEN